MRHPQVLGWSRLRGAFADPARPALCSVLFWISLPGSLAARVTGLGGAPHRFGLPVLLAALAALAVTWLALPWERETAGRRAVLPPAFLLLGMAGLVVVEDNSLLLVVLVAMTNVVYVLGVRAGAAAALALAGLAFAVTLAYPGHGLVFAAAQAAAFGLLASFAVAAAAAVIEARRRRAETQRLLGELASAHEELGRYAERVRELTVAEERARMAREMHDSIGHHLTVIKMDLENAERLRERLPERAWTEVAEAKRLTQQALTDTRRWVRALRPLSLDQGLGARAMAALSDSFARTGLDVRFEVEGCERGLDADAELVLYRALQEGLTNALRHSGASRVTASLRYEDRQVVLVVSDDGAGAAAPALAAGFGLSALADRARAAGGSLAAGSGQSGGFTLQLELPA